MEPDQIKPGDIVRIAAFDDVPEHDFEVLSVEEDCLTGIALSGPLAGQYGEPDLQLVLSHPR
jgi:hypothetical protein